MVHPDFITKAKSWKGSEPYGIPPQWLHWKSPLREGIQSAIRDHGDTSLYSQTVKQI